jgi:hypothetical protein
VVPEVFMLSLTRVRRALFPRPSRLTLRLNAVTERATTFTLLQPIVALLHNKTASARFLDKFRKPELYLKVE